MKKWLILLSLCSFIFFSTNGFAEEMYYRGAVIGKTIPEYFLCQFEYDYTKAGIDYYTARQSTIPRDITRIAIYNNKLLSVDVCNFESYRVFFIATVRAMVRSYGHLTNSITHSKHLIDFIWDLKETTIIVTLDDIEGLSRLTFMSPELFKKYLESISLL